MNGFKRSFYSISGVAPGFSIDAALQSPPSKPMSQRFLVAAALARGTTTIHNSLVCSETERMLHALTGLGATFERTAETITVHGIDGNIRRPKLKAAEREDNEALLTQPQGSNLDLYADGSGLVLRTMIALASGSPDPLIIGGNYRLTERPIKPLLESLMELGIELNSWIDEKWIRLDQVRRAGDWRPPIKVVSHGIRGGAVLRIPGDVSSQFITALLFGIPVMRWASNSPKEPIRIEVDPQTTLFSASYIRQTLDVLDKFGVAFDVLDRDHRKVDFRDTKIEPRVFTIAPEQRLTAPSAPIEIEGDYTSASYQMATIALHPGRLVLRGLRPDSMQGEAYMLHIMRSLLGAQSVTFRADELVLENRGQWSSPSHDFDVTDGPNITPTLMAIAAGAAEGCRMRVRGADLTRFHKTARVDAMSAALESIGVAVDILRVGPDSHSAGFEIARRGGYKTPESPLDYGGDHRLAMSLAVLSTKLPGATPVRGLSQVGASYPNFLEDMAKLGFTMQRVWA